MRSDGFASTNPLFAEVCFKGFQGGHKPFNVFGVPRMHQIQIKGGDRRAMQNSTNTPDDDEINLVLSKGLENGKEISL